MGEDFHRGREVQEVEDFGEQLNPGKDKRCFRNHLATTALYGGHRRFGGDITGSNIFGEKRPQQVVARGRVEEGGHGEWRKANSSPAFGESVSRRAGADLHRGLFPASGRASRDKVSPSCSASCEDIRCTSIPPHRERK